MSVLVWTMVGIAFWHFAVLVPDKFYGGIVGAFVVAVIGAVATGYALPVPGLPTRQPARDPGGPLRIPGALGGLALSYWYGARREPQD